MPTIENPIRKAGQLADTLVDILNIAKVGLVAGLEQAFPKTTFVPDKALSWIQLHDAENLDKINKRVGSAVQALMKSAGQIQSGFGDFYDLLDNFRQDEDAPQEITYDYVAEQMAEQRIDVDCWNINLHRRTIERGLQEAFSQAAAIRCAVEEAFAAYAVLRVCPPDICDDPRGPTGEIYLQKQPIGEAPTHGATDAQAHMTEMEKKLAEALSERDLAQNRAKVEQARADAAEEAKTAAEARESQAIAAMAAAAKPVAQRSGRARRPPSAAGRTGGGAAVSSRGAAAKPQAARARPTRVSARRRTARPPAGGTTTNVP